MRRIPQRKGFSLLEVMLALLLFMGMVVAATRLAWVEARVRAGVEAAEWRRAACAEVLEAWRGHPDRAALARPDSSNRWEVILVPDASWFPLPASSGKVATSLWRRRAAVGSNGEPVWEVEWYDERTAQWRWSLRLQANGDWENVSP